RFGVNDDLPPLLSMALGAGETTLMQITAGYAMLVNGGRRIEPSLIDRIQDRRGRTVMRHDTRTCTDCEVATGWRHQAEPQLPDLREQIIDSATAYQMVSMLEGVVQRGTGVRVNSVGKPLAGKTGTTNASQDAWFIGFSPDLAVGVYVGFDEPRTLGPREQGASVAAPIFRDFMAEALADEPNIPFRIPRSVRLVRIDYETGLPARNGSKSVILEAFRPGTEPSESAGAVLDGAGSYDAAGLRPVGVGGLY
ncbi:MAG: penicillin-binding protein, partial [Proteobacteria bacterium]|nr:penicillin-binding protein [Pseudomonadota bacterium]